MAWTFGGTSFDWLRENKNGVPTEPTWKRRPRLNIRPLLGTGDADISRIGYEPWQISGGIYVGTTAAVSALLLANGTEATLSNGSESWTAVLELDLDSIVADPDGGHVGQATFTRPRAAG